LQPDSRLLVNGAKKEYGLSNLRIHLIRHGQTDWNSEKRVQGHAESELTSLGQMQATALAPQLAEHDINHVYCSSSVRTRQTAALLFADNQQPTEYCDQLKEIYLGPWEGLLQAQVRKTWPDAFQHFWHEPHRFALEEAETFETVQARAMERFQRIILAHSQGDVAVVSHGVLIKTILCALEPRPISKLWEPPLMTNCSHSIVEVSRGEAPRIIQYAEAVEVSEQPA